MRFLISLLLLVSSVTADGTLQKPETTSAPVLEPRDLISDISRYTSALAAWPSYFESLESDNISLFSSGFANITSSAASASSSLGLKLSTADAAASTSIHSELSQVSANVSSASVALQAAQSAAQSAVSLMSKPPSATSSTSTGVGCVQTAAAGMGALVGGIAVLAQM